MYNPKSGGGWEDTTMVSKEEDCWGEASLLRNTGMPKNMVGANKFGGHNLILIHILFWNGTQWREGHAHMKLMLHGNCLTKLFCLSKYIDEILWGFMKF